ncbi:hypothetical protein [Pseudomonas mediterranea]|uniref:hypothetical protein n=1 Tax=Pseudomonas mediterranea TaxID=183795 RepID=UPI0006D8CCE3|nr:hypothetical protein [Pseudomonas mediterranea]
MSTPKPRLDAATFDAVYTGRHSPEILAALRSVLVDGEQLAVAARVHGVSRAGLYRALNHPEGSKASQALEPVVAYCPQHRAAQLRQLIAKQLDIWKAKDAEAQATTPNPQPVGEQQA